MMNLPSSPSNRNSFFISTVILSLLSACVTKPPIPVPEGWTRKSLPALTKTCTTTEKSGFSADLMFTGEGSARIEGVWDTEGNLSGNILNTIGEDVLNFRIDTTGFLEADSPVQKSESLFQALDFLGQLGSNRTRSLLCSGLFLQEKAISHSSVSQALNESSTVIETSGAKWYIESRLAPDPTNIERYLVTSHITSDSFLLKKTVATIEWVGTQRMEKIQPTSLRVTTSRLEVKLSFLDFE